MKDLAKTCNVAVVQAAPVLFDKEATITKTVQLIEEAAAKGAELILFPESFIPAYPLGFSYGYIVCSRTMQGREDWKRYYDGSMIVPSADTDRIGEAARAANAYVCIGITERDAVNATLYCSLLYFAPDGALLGCHRKLKPTGSERLIWGEGDSSTLHAFDTPWGMLGGLICWENYMPLARTAMYQKGVSLYLAPTADAREEWQCTMRHIALEGRCYVLGCNQFVTREMYPRDFNYQSELDAAPGSCAAAAASSLTRLARSSPAPSGIVRRSSMPRWRWTRLSSAAWISTPPATTPARMSFISTSGSRLAGRSENWGRNKMKIRLGILLILFILILTGCSANQPPWTDEGVRKLKRDATSDQAELYFG